MSTPKLRLLNFKVDILKIVPYLKNKQANKL